MDITAFQGKLSEKGINLTDNQIKQFDIYFQTLIEWNQKINLTAITDQEEVYEKHFFDSITAAFYYDFSNNVSICDVGAGAGFPSIPLKICFPNIEVTIVDSLQKRINFLNQLAKELDLTGVSFYHDRAETFGKKQDFREQYDIVMARAVARMQVLSELCLPLTKINGTFIAMKGPNLEDELQDSKKAIETLGGELKQIYTFDLPISQAERNIALVTKKYKTPNKYPRKPGVPNKTPIV